MDIRYPSQVDAAVNKALEPLAKNKKGDAAKGAGGDDESVRKAKKVLEFVTGALDKRSARMPLPDASTTLAHAIDAPSAELRRTVRLFYLPWLLHDKDFSKDALSSMRIWLYIE